MTGLGGESAVCFMFYLLGDAGAGFTLATCLGLETASVALEPHEQQMKGRLMCTAACGHTLSTGHSHSRWPGIVELNLGE